MEVNNDFGAFSTCSHTLQPILNFPSTFPVAIESFISPLLPDQTFLFHLFELPELKAGGCYNMAWDGSEHCTFSECVVQQRETESVLAVVKH